MFGARKQQSWQIRAMQVGDTVGEWPARGSDSTRERVLDYEGVAHLRRRMLERALWAAWLALSVALLMLLREALRVERGRWGVVAGIACAWMAIGVAAVWRGLDLRLRGAALYLGFAIACGATVRVSVV